MELIFASNNQHKVEEIQAIAGKEIKLKSLNDIGCFDEIPETGDTFAANAGQKSHYIFDRYHLDCFADDSGLSGAKKDFPETSKRVTSPAGLCSR